MVFESLICSGFSICRVVLDFIAKCLTAQATKTVTLGPLLDPVPARSARNDEGKQRKVNKNEEEEEGELPSTQESSSVEIDSILKIDENEKPKVEVQVKQPPKKMVSINENAEVIYPSKDKKKRKRSFDKLPSVDEQKPIKSILKGGCNLIDKNRVYRTREALSQG